MEHYRAVIKVTFVGAGSIEFTRNVVTDLCGYPEFRGELHLSLYDISAERLAHAERLARRISGQSGAGATVSATRDRREALAGARYVINDELRTPIRRNLHGDSAGVLGAAFLGDGGGERR